MTGVSGSFDITFKLAEFSIAEEDLLNFTLVEEAGNILPTFKISFTISSEKIFRVLNEGNDIEISFGRKEDDLINAKLIPISVKSHNSGYNKKVVEVVGIYSAASYLNSSKLFISSKKSAISVLKDLVSTHFTPKFSISTSKDSQYWIQPNISDRKFANNLLLHSNLGTSFPLFGISSNGEFICKDAKTEVGKPFKWRFTNTSSDPRDIMYDGDYVLESDIGLVNTLTGYSRQKLLFNLEEGTEEYTLGEDGTILADSNTTIKNSEVEKKFAAAGMINENVHPNYWSSYMNNISKLSSFSKNSITLSFTGKMFPVKILDLVFFKDKDVETDRTSEYYSGLYFITRVSRSIVNRVLTTVVKLSRESINRPKTGDNLTTSLGGITF